MENKVIRKNIVIKLLNIQTSLVCGKSQYNSFGGYSFRSCEDILEALKPLLKEQKCIVNLSDSIELVGNRYYVKAVATLIDIENGEDISSVAYAREDENRKGMDTSQITGATSSYARKYALNGLFAIDDIKDADSTNTHDSTSNSNNKKAKEEKSSSDNISIEDAGSVVVNFGRYKDKTLKEIASKDMPYIEWLSNNASSENVKQGASKLLSGENKDLASEDDIAECPF